MAVSAGARSITFTWEAPQPHLQNGAILSYTILCMPTFNRQLSPVTKPGSVTWTGFSPLTLYNCSISASNSVGSGPPAHNTVTTGDDSKYTVCVHVQGVYTMSDVHLQLVPFHCEL